MLFRPWRPKLGIPVIRMVPNSAGLRVTAVIRNWLTVLPRRNMDSRMQKLMVWLRAVARPAPAVPMPSPKMNSGSSAMFSKPPVTRPIMAKLALPS